MEVALPLVMQHAIEKNSLSVRELIGPLRSVCRGWKKMMDRELQVLKKNKRKINSCGDEDTNDEYWFVIRKARINERASNDGRQWQFNVLSTKELQRHSTTENVEINNPPRLMQFKAPLPNTHHKLITDLLGGSGAHLLQQLTAFLESGQGLCSPLWCNVAGHGAICAIVERKLDTEEELISCSYNNNADLPSPVHDIIVFNPLTGAMDLLPQPQLDSTTLKNCEMQTSTSSDGNYYLMVSTMRISTMIIFYHLGKIDLALSSPISKKHIEVFDSKSRSWKECSQNLDSASLTHYSQLIKGDFFCMSLRVEEEFEDPMWHVLAYHAEQDMWTKMSFNDKPAGFSVSFRKVLKYKTRILMFTPITRFKVDPVTGKSGFLCVSFSALELKPTSSTSTTATWVKLASTDQHTTLASLLSNTSWSPVSIMVEGHLVCVSIQPPTNYYSHLLPLPLLVYDMLHNRWYSVPLASELPDFYPQCVSLIKPSLCD